jgi:hypothetical protein
MTPVYRLALNGYDGDKADEFRMFRTRLPILRLLQLGPNVDDAIKVDKRENINKPEVIRNAPRVTTYDWLTPVPVVKYTPLHWFAFWDDYRCVRFLLNLVTHDK